MQGFWVEQGFIPALPLPISIKGFSPWHQGMTYVMLFFFAPKSMPRISISVLTVGHGAQYLPSFGRCGSVRRLLTFILLFTSTFVAAATMGSFTGEVVRDVSVENGKKWIFLKSGKRTIRRVDISDAPISYSSEIPKANRASNPSADLHEGARLTVTASQDENGEWKATKVEIVAVGK